MTSVSDVTSPRVIMKPYTPDPDRRSHKLLRLLVIILVSGFCLIQGLAFALFAPYLMIPFFVPPAVLALAVVWALPETRRAPTAAMVVLTYAFFVGLVMWPNYIAFAPPGLPWITMVRITGFPLVLVLLVCVSVSADFRSKIATTLKAAPVVWQMLVAFAVIQAISIGFSKQPFQSVDKFVIAQLSWTAIFFVSAYVFAAPGRVERMAALFWGMSIFIAIIAIWEWKHAGVLWAGHIPSFLKIPDPSVDRALAFHGRGSDGIYRAMSTFSTPLGLGEYVALVLPFVLQFAFGAYRAPVRLAALATIPLLLFTVFVSGSRLGTVGCMMSFFLYLLAWGVLRWRRDRESLMAPAVLFAFFPVALLLTVVLTIVWPRMHVMVFGNGQAQTSTLARQAQLRLAIPKLVKHPWGYGESMGADTVGFYEPGGDLTLDSYYITVAIEYGVVGFVLYYGFFGYIVFFAAKTRLSTRNAEREYEFLTVLAIAVSNFFIIKMVFSQQENHPIVYMYAGMVVALAARLKSQTAQPALATPPSGADLREAVAARRGQDHLLPAR
ncbi:MAG TPA: O-antigen ligase family protein [Caulobacteraceae bacterium]|nr:O-antigen ligase family protein [Caulobacteraceae bacterium]